MVEESYRTALELFLAGRPLIQGDFGNLGCSDRHGYVAAFSRKGTIETRFGNGFGGRPPKDHPPSKKSGLRRPVMTKQEAKEYLSAVRPDGADAPDPTLQPALELAREDSELGSWLVRQQEFDKILIDKFSSIRPPEGLRENILGSIEKTARPIQFWQTG
jgi:hypothetical protein